MNIVWVVVLSVASLLFLVLLLIGILICRRSSKPAKNSSIKSHQTKPNMTIMSKENYASLRKNMHNSNNCGLYDNKMPGSTDEDENNMDERNNLFQKQISHHHHHQSQQIIMNNQQVNAGARLSCSTSSQASTLIKPPQMPQRTPHHQPLVINNPNHMMMNHLMNPLSINSNGAGNNNNINNNPITNNSNTLTDFEFYSNIHQQQNQQQIFVNNGNNVRSVSINEDAISQQNEFSIGNNQNGEFANSFFNSNNNESLFLRNVSRPKPIAIPIGNANLSNMSSPIEQTTNNAFVSNSTRKSFRNLRKFFF